MRGLGPRSHAFDEVMKSLAQRARKCFESFSPCAW